MRRELGATTLVLVLFACGRSQTVTLSGQGPLGENGSALVTEGNNTVTVELTFPPMGATQPAELRNGRCGVDGSLFAALSDVVNGKSVSTVPRKYAELQGSTYINVYAGGANAREIVSCGNLQ